MAPAKISAKSGSNSKANKAPTLKVIQSNRNKRQRVSVTMDKSEDDMDTDELPTTKEPSLSTILNEIRKSNTQNQDNFKELNKSIQLIRANVTDNSNKINSLSQDIQFLQRDGHDSNDSIAQLQRDCENTERELKKIYLIVSGLIDSESESVEKLLYTVNLLITSLTGKNVPLDSVKRFGFFKHDKPRQVKIRFLNLTDRDLVWANRLNTPKSIFINEDLPYVTRRDNAILRSKSKILTREGKTSTINWSQKTITTDTQIFKIFNGELKSKSIPASQPTLQTPLFQKASSFSYIK